MPETTTCPPAQARRFSQNPDGRLPAAVRPHGDSPRSGRLIACLAGFLMFLLVASANRARAQDDDPDAATDDSQAQETRLDEYNVSAKRLHESLEDPPAFVQTIRMEDYAGRFVTTDEVLSHAVGVDVRQFGGLGKLSTVSIRGASSDQVVVLVDGVRVNPVAGGGVDLSTIPPAHIDRIEVLRGGESAFYGEGAVGGVVNIITKRPREGSLNSASVTTGSYNTLQTSAARSQGWERVGYLASATYLHSDGDFSFTNNNGTELDTSDDYRDTRKNNETDNRGALAKLRYAPSDRVELGVQNEFFSADRGLPGLVTFPSPHVHESELRNAATLTAAATDWPIKGLGIRTRATYSYHSTRYRDPYGEQTGVPLVSEQAEHAPEFEPDFQYILGRHQILTAGALYRINELLDADFGNPHRETWAAWLADQVFFGDDLITIVPALRYDTVSDAGSQTSPKIGMTVKPTAWATLKGNAGSSFRAPNFSELYFNHGFVEGNTELKPERAVSYDAGFQIGSGPVFFENAWFRTDVTDLIEYVLVSGFRYKPFNIGAARLEGYEATASLSPVSWASLTGSYTLTYALDRGDEGNRRNKQLPGRPRHRGYARLDTRYRALAPYLEFDYTGGNYVTPTNTKLLPARRLWNSGVVANPDGVLRVGLELKNLTDEEALDVRGFPLPGRSFFMTVETVF